MRAESEFYRGIEYVCISNLPVDQKEKIKSSLPTEKIIKILKDGILIEDCLQYQDYLTWFSDHYQGAMISRSGAQAVAGVFKFSVK